MAQAAGTTLELVKKLTARITGEQLLTQDALKSLDADACLDERDDPAFDSRWVAIHRQVQERAQLMGIDLENIPELSALREAAFVKTHQLVGEGELPSYVSDDFGLLGSALVVEVEDPWLNGLWVSYVRGRIPCGKIPEIGGRLIDLVSNVCSPGVDGL
jgi:hypothetical protein